MEKKNPSRKKASPAQHSAVDTSSTLNKPEADTSISPLPAAPKTSALLAVPIASIDDHSHAQYIADLEQELKSTRAYLQTLIDKLKSSNEELQSSNKELQSANQMITALFDNAPIGIHIFDKHGFSQQMNEAYRRLLGLPKKTTGISEFNVLTDPFIQATKQDAAFRRAYAGETVVTQSCEINLGAGDNAWPMKRSAICIEQTVFPLKDRAGEITAVVALVQDVTERKRTEEALRLGKEQYQNFIAQSFEAISRTEFDEPIDITLPVEEQIDLIYQNAYMAECNQAMADMYNIPSPQAFVGVRLIEAHGGKDNPVNRAAFKKFIENGYKSTNDETHEYAADGRPLWFLSNTVGTIENGYLTRLWGTAIDITERKLAEEMLRESEELYHQMFNEHAAAKMLIDPDTGQIVEANESACRFYGYAIDVMQDMNIFQINTLPAEEVARLMQEAKSGSTNLFIFQHRLASGKIRDVEVHSTPINRKGKIVLYSIIHDITHRMQAENALRKSEADLKETQEIAHLGRWELNLTTNRIQWSDSIFNIFEINPQTFGLSYADFLDAVHPEDRGAVNDAYLTSLQDKTPYNIEHRLLMRNGRIKWVSEKCHTEYAADGSPLISVGVVQDITERKQRERVTQLRLDLTEFSGSHSLEELMRKALDEIGLITNSPIGFYHFVESDQQTISLQTWSTRTLQEFCKAEGNGLHYPLDQAGVWADCIRERRTIIHNNYASLPNRRGLPPGHAEVIRELITPVFRQGRSVSILGVGNKPTEYTEQDVQTISYIADVIWEIVQHKKAEAEIQRLYAQAQEDARIKAELLNEVNHRVKNNLMRIQSIFDLKSLEAGLGRYEQELLADMRTRIEGLLVVHSMLSNSLWMPLELGDLCQQIVSGVLGASPIKSSLAFDLAFQPQSCSRQMVIPGQATTLALILNELAMNSIKYAFAQRESGRIQLEVKQESETENHIFQLVFRDDGPGWPEEVLAGNREGLGLRLIRGSLHNFIPGHIQLLNDNGAVALLRFKLAQL